MVRRRWAVAGVLAVSAALAACSGGGGGSAGAPAPGGGSSAGGARTAGPRLDQVQVVASHNSYHVQAEPQLFEAMVAVAPELARTIEYTHPPLDAQLDEGVRGLELDVFADPDGGLFARRAGPALLGLPSAQGPAELSRPGFKVLHVQDLDFGTTCLTLVDCLRVVRRWSDAHPRHVPVVVQLEPKQDAPDLPMIELARPVAYTPALMRDLDREVRSVFGERRLLSPDDVRRGAPTVAAGLRRHGWPRLDDVRGQVLFALDSTGPQRDALRAAFPGLRGSALFDSADPGEPTAAYAVRNDPRDTAAIRPALDARMLVRTRADADLAEARSGDTSTRDAAFASGAQVVSTDFFEQDPAVGGDYVVALPGGAAWRCNPVTAPPTCRSPRG